MLRRTLFLACPALLSAQFPVQRPRDEDKEVETRLPNGKSQRDEILKGEHEKSLTDAASLIKLAEELKADLEKAGSFVVSVQTIKKTEEIEKISKRIRGRLKRA